MTEAYPDPYAAPDLRAFVIELHSPTYQPPVLVYDETTPGGLAMPGSAVTDFAPDVPLDPEAIQPTTGVLTYLRCDERGAIFSMAGSSRKIIVPAEGMEIFERRLGDRRILGDFVPEEEDLDVAYGRITAVHGVEPLYTGQDLGEHPPETVVVEGFVTDFVPDLEVDGIVPGAEVSVPVPMVQVQIDPTDPHSRVWIPCPNLLNANRDWARQQPVHGDIVQLRLFPGLELRALRGPGAQRIMQPDLNASGYIIRESPIRSTIRIERMHHTEAVAAHLRGARSPERAAQILGQYLEARYATSYTLDSYGSTEYARLAIEPAERTVILAALRSHRWSAAAMPAMAGLLEREASPQPTSRDQLTRLRQMSETLAALDASRGDRQPYLNLQGSLLTMTRPEIRALTLRLVDDALDGTIGPRPLNHLLTLLDDETCVAFTADAVERFRALDSSRLVTPAISNTAAEVFRTGTTQQQVALMRLFSDAVNSITDLNILHEQPWGQQGSDLLSQFTMVAWLMTRVPNRIDRQDRGINEFTYLAWRAGTRAFLAALDRVGPVANELFSSEQHITLAHARLLIAETLPT